MRITHLIDNYKVSKEVLSGASLFSTNRLGAYLWLWGNMSYSRYQGWFVRIGGEMHKIIDEIKINNLPSGFQEINNIWTEEGHKLQRTRSGTIESFSLSQESNALVYQLSHVSEINLLLDVRSSYEVSRWGRNYDIYFQKDFIFIKYQQKTNKTFFICIPKKGSKNWVKVGEWEKKTCVYDKKRHSSPYEVYVYNALKVISDRLIIGVGRSEKEAKASIQKTNMLQLEPNEKHSTGSRKAYNASLKFFQALAEKSLKSLLVYNNRGNILGLYAGLPWFFQFWLRDEAISLKALSLIGQNISKEFFTNRLAQTTKKESNRAFKYSPDGLLWLIYRYLSLYAAKAFPEDGLIEKIGGLVRKSESCGALEGGLSWMDTLVRQGAIEHYCLQLAIYQFAHKISHNTLYLEKERRLARQVKAHFWNGKILADSKSSWTLRPNVFLAYYLYPNLLTREEWLICFDNALDALWLDWGGIATVDKNSSLYVSNHTGEDPKSYHNGDSWFWLNNIAAIAMLRLDKLRYQNKIQKIIKASQKDILWYNALGYGSELSSASQFNPSGSPIQAWSLATYLELLACQQKDNHSTGR